MLKNIKIGGRIEFLAVMMMLFTAVIGLILFVHTGRLSSTLEDLSADAVLTTSYLDQGDRNKYDKSDAAFKIR